MEKQKTTPVKNYDKTDRNFQATDEDVKAGKKEHERLQPEKYPVNNQSGTGGIKNK